MEGFLRTVARLDAVDPLTTEIVRLRGARINNCRICKSRRNVSAMARGADQSTFEQIDHYETSTLDEHHKVALRLTDAVSGIRRRTRTGWSNRVPPLPAHSGRGDPPRLVRNATNKVAVVLGGDEAVVKEGVEYFDLDRTGDLVYGLAPSR